MVGQLSVDCLPKTSLDKPKRVSIDKPLENSLNAPIFWIQFMLLHVTIHDTDKNEEWHEVDRWDIKSEVFLAHKATVVWYPGTASVCNNYLQITLCKSNSHFCFASCAVLLVVSRNIMQLFDCVVPP